MADEILESFRELPAVSPGAVEAFARATDRLLRHVYDRLTSNPDIDELVGGNPLELMRDRQRNHAAYMYTMVKIGAYELVGRIPWEYRTYKAKGFSYDYFPAEFVAWQLALRECLDDRGHASELSGIYRWLMEHHEDMIGLSREVERLRGSVEPESEDLCRAFLSLLLHANTQGCLMLADKSVRSAPELKNFYSGVICPAMYEIGRLWEANKISVAEEHVSTAIVGRVMAALYPRCALFETTKGKAIVSAGPNEFHEIGARMVADFMEMDGWDVTYLGAKAAAAELTRILKRDRPFMVVLSVATVFNLDRAREMIRAINNDDETGGVKVLVGGYAFHDMPRLWRSLGADGYAADAESALQVADAWWTAGSGDHA